MFDELKKRVYQSNMKLYNLKLAILTWGNTSERSKDGKYFAIKPSGISYEKMTKDDIVVLDMEGKVVEGNLNPSSDTKTHLYLYKKFKEIKAIVHTHSPYSIAWAQTGKNIPCYGTTHADNFYGDIHCTRALTKEEINSDYEHNTGVVIAETIKKQKLNIAANPGILVKNHGPFSYSTKSSNHAVDIALTMEEISKMALFTIQIDNNVKPADKYLIDKHFNRKHGKNAYYGQKNK